MSIQILTHKPDSAGLKANKLYFLQKKNKKQVLEQGLPGTVLEGSGQSGSG